MHTTIISLENALNFIKHMQITERFQNEHGNLHFGYHTLDENADKEPVCVLIPPSEDNGVVFTDLPFEKARLKRLTVAPDIVNNSMQEQRPQH
ncbi:hypothetical protein ACQZV8_14395 [Magnetococcales bacterium HHB-1]